MSDTRKIVLVKHNTPTLEGAGVRLKRVFGFQDVPKLDPFLLLDHFGSGDPADYLAGFPWHPHRGIETVTYILEGSVEHGDSLGNGGVIGDGDVQWMTAGGGIIHQEMPKKYEGVSRGFQLWVNLPEREKMMMPRYRDVAKGTIPAVEAGDGVVVKVVAGEESEVKGPVVDLVVDCAYMDVIMGPGASYSHAVPDGYRLFTYVFEGGVDFGNGVVESDHLAVFDDAGTLSAKTGAGGGRFLMVYGKPLNEPVAWRGPIVMNTHKELALAFSQLKDGTFIQ